MALLQTLPPILWSLVMAFLAGSTALGLGFADPHEDTLGAIRWFRSALFILYVVCVGGMLLCLRSKGSRATPCQRIDGVLVIAVTAFFVYIRQGMTTAYTDRLARPLNPSVLMAWPYFLIAIALIAWIAKR